MNLLCQWVSGGTPRHCQAIGAGGDDVDDSVFVGMGCVQIGRYGREEDLDRGFQR